MPYISAANRLPALAFANSRRAHDEDHGDDVSHYEPSEEGDSLQSEDGVSNPLKLKGTQFPGMGGFDAATEDQRRMRNQRKPKEVVKHLEFRSRLITTVETVHDLSLEPLRERDVYDDPSEDESIVSY